MSLFRKALGVVMTGDIQHFCQICNKMYYFVTTCPIHGNDRWNPFWTQFTYQPSNDLEPLINELKPALDRSWENETPEQIIAIAINALYNRNTEIKHLRDELVAAKELLKIERLENEILTGKLENIKKITDESS